MTAVDGLTGDTNKLSLTFVFDGLDVFFFLIFFRFQVFTVAVEIIVDFSGSTSTWSACTCAYLHAYTTAYMRTTFDIIVRIV